MDPRLEETTKAHLGRLTWQSIQLASRVETLAVQLAQVEQERREQRVALAGRLRELASRMGLPEPVAQALRDLADQTEAPPAAAAVRGEAHGR